MAIKSELATVNDFNRINRSIDRLDEKSAKFRSKSGSIISAAKGNIFEFPVFISSSVPLDYATATSSLLEQVYASYLQMAISINPVIDHTNAVNGLQFAGLRSDTNKYLEYTDTMYQHDVCHAVYDNGETVVEFNLISCDDSDAKVLLESVNYQPLSEFDHYFVEVDYPAKKKKKNKKNNQSSTMDNVDTNTTSPSYTSSGNNSSSSDTDTADITKLRREYSEKLRQSDRLIKAFEKNSETVAKTEEHLKSLEDRVKNANAKEKEQLQKEIELTKKERDQVKDNAEKRELEKKQLEKELEKLENEAKKSGYDLKKAREDSKDTMLNRMDKANRGRVKAPQVLRASDMDKLNTMKPILMTVDLNVKANDGSLSPVEYVVGVKTFNRLIDADMIPEVAEYPLKEMDKVMRKAKWRAGELKFFSDIVFRIKQKKQTAADKRNPKRKWYRRLYELAHMKGDAPTVNILNGGSVLASIVMDKRGKTKSATGVIPNVTMVISKADVDICKMQTGIDLLNGHTAAKFCKELFMMGMVVIDSDNERLMMLLPELHDEYDVHSIASVNHQLASLDSSNKNMRDWFKAMNR